MKVEEKYINYKKRQTSADILVSHFAYIYDLNFKQSLCIIKEREYIDKLYKRFKFNNKETTQKYDKIYELAKQYINEGRKY